MKKLILVMGDLATGKTTFANKLSQRYDINIFFKDSIKEVLGDTIGFANREENLKLSKATNELMLFIFEQFAKVNKDLILESNFRQAELERFQKAACDNGYEVLMLVLHGDVDVLYKRYLNRMHNENRHPVHLSTTLDVFDDFKAYLDGSRYEIKYENTISINADDFSYQTDVEILTRIDEFMKDR